MRSNVADVSSFVICRSGRGVVWDSHAQLGFALRTLQSRSSSNRAAHTQVSAQ